MAFTLKQLRYFLAAAEAGQVSAAARAVNVSQSAMTLALRDLEALLGVSLFERKPSGLLLTREGHALLAHARAIQDQVSQAFASVRKSEDPVAGRLKLGVTFTLSSYFLFPKLAQLRRAHPAIDVELVEADRPELEAMLLSGAIDLALLLTSNLERRAELRTLTFHRSPRRLWTAAGHPLAVQDSVRLADLADHPVVLLKADEAGRQAQSIWKRHGIRPQVAFESISIEAVRNMVASGLAITVLSDVVYRPWTVDGLRVERRALVETLPTLDVGMAWRKGRRLDRAAAAFRALFAAETPAGA